MANINDKLIQLAEAKSNIRDAIIAKGVEVDASLPFLQYANKIGEISSGGGETVKKPNVILNSENLVVTDDNIVSGFTNTAFPRFGMINIGTGSWEFNVKIKTPETFTWSTSSNNAQYILSCRGSVGSAADALSAGRYGIHIYVKKATTDTVQLCADIANTNGTGWLFTSGSGFIGGTLNVNTVYYVRLSFNGTDTYKMEYSTDGTTYTVIKESTSTTNTYPTLRSNQFGIYNGSALENAFTGLQVYLEDTYIKAGSDIVWNGTIDIATAPRQELKISSDKKSIVVPTGLTFEYMNWETEATDSYTTTEEASISMTPEMYTDTATSTLPMNFYTSSIDTTSTSTFTTTSLPLFRSVYIKANTPYVLPMAAFNTVRENMRISQISVTTGSGSVKAYIVKGILFTGYDTEESFMAAHSENIVYESQPYAMGGATAYLDLSECILEGGQEYTIYVERSYGYATTVDPHTTKSGITNSTTRCVKKVETNFYDTDLYISGDVWNDQASFYCTKYSTEYPIGTVKINENKEFYDVVTN